MNKSMPESLLTSSQSDQTTTAFVGKKEPRRQKSISDNNNTFRTVLLVDHRDEAFARLAGDFAAMGIWVERACSAAEVFRRIASCSSNLMIVNADMPNESGWLLAGKLRVVWPTARLWLYAPRPFWSSEYDQGLAHFLGVAELIHYEGDLFLLAKEIRSRLTRSQRPAPSCSGGVGTSRVGT